ncbi:LIM domain transcription factor LMO4-like [Scleropages formosus]|uniref:LIM domain transcription factor LMO4-like n=1 Tax=Scleropages formosus TaxID=113540 RepID=A0A0P7UQX4_SCLFO|nr:LIM domain transcription factor LMO4-like [Scleropages formosus]
MVNPSGSAQPPPGGAGTLPWKRCAGCGGKIADRFLLYAMDSYWHSRCLKCSCCQAQLGEIGTSCYTKSGMILCRNDYIRLFGNSGACSACGQSIPASELVMRAQGNVYHLKCFTCSTCRNRLVPGDRFHYINGSLCVRGGGVLKAELVPSFLPSTSPGNNYPSPPPVPRTRPSDRRQRRTQVLDPCSSTVSPKCSPLTTSQPWQPSPPPARPAGLPICARSRGLRQDIESAMNLD